MATIKVRFDGRVFVPLQPVDLPAGTTAQIRMPDPEAAGASESDTAGRLAELHSLAIQTADDFDAPLPDDFWLGKV